MGGAVRDPSMQYAVRKYRFTTDSYNAPVMPFCSLTTVKVPPLILTLRAYWNIVGFKEGRAQLKVVVIAGRRSVRLGSDVALPYSSHW